MHGPIEVRWSRLLRCWVVFGRRVWSERYEDAVLVAFRARWRVQKWGSVRIYVKDGSSFLCVIPDEQDINWTVRLRVRRKR